MRLLIQINPILPPIAKIDRGKNNWAQNRLKTCLIQEKSHTIEVNRKGKQYIKSTNSESSDIMVAYVYCGFCLGLFSFFYEGFGICCLCRKMHLKELTMVVESRNHYLKGFRFSTDSIKIFNIFYKDTGNSVIKFSKMKSLVELSIQSTDSNTSFQEVMIDELKGCENLRKLTLQLPEISGEQISSVVGYISSLVSLNICFKDEFNFDHMNLSLPKLKELSFYNQNLQSLEKNSQLLKELLFLRISTRQNVDVIQNILKNIVKNGVPLRHLSLMIDGDTGQFQDNMDQIRQIQPLQILEIRKLFVATAECILDISQLKNLQILDLKYVKLAIRGIQQCYNLKKFVASEGVDLSNFSICKDSLQNLEEVKVTAYFNNLKYLSQGLSNAQNLQSIKINLLENKVNDEYLDELIQAIKKVSKLKLFSLQARDLDISDNALIKLSNAIFHQASKLQMFELKSDRIPSISGQSFELLFQSAAAVCKSFVVFNLDVKHNDNLTDQSIKEVIPSFNKIRSNVSKLDISISNLGRIKEEMIQKVRGTKSNRISNFSNILPTIKDMILKEQGTEDALTIFQTAFKY